MTLLTIGDLVADLIVPIDHFPIEAYNHQLAETIRIEPGGIGNTLIMAQRLGLHAQAIGSIGDDHFGNIALDALTQEGVDTSLVVTQPDATTTTAIVMVDKQADHVFVGKFGTTDPLAFDPAWATPIARADALFFNGYSLAGHGSVDHPDLLRCLSLARQGNVPIFFDLGPAFIATDRTQVEDVLQQSTIFLATDEELCGWLGQDDLGQENLARATAQMLCDYPLAAVVIKLGAAGCRIFTAEETICCEGVDMIKRDTAGAGDAFAAAFIAAYLDGKSLQQIGAFANTVGAATVTQIGTGTSLPTKPEIESIFSAHVPEK